MKIKANGIMWPLLASLLFLCGLSAPVFAWGGCDPPCTGCCNCVYGSCVNNSSECSGCCHCSNCSCVNGNCGGCCKCSACSCVGDNSQCDHNNCFYTCNDDCECVLCYGEPHKFCCFGNCCSFGQICCYGSCCDPGQCCVNGECVDPMCDNCHSVSDIIYECHHWATDPNGTPCSTIECIKNVMNTATCDYKGDDWPCRKSRCDTTLVDPLDPPGEIIQTIHDSPCTGGTVDWETWKELHYGCTEGCWLQAYTKSCEVFWCADNPIPGRGGPRGSKKKCGCD